MSKMLADNPNKETYLFQKVGNNAPKTEEYIWELDDIPPSSQFKEFFKKRSQIQNFLDLDSDVSEDDVSQDNDEKFQLKVTDVKFKSGILTNENICHDLSIFISETQISYRLKLDGDADEGVHWDLLSCKAKFYSNDELHSSNQLSTMEHNCNGDPCWVGILDIPITGCWNENVNRIRLCFVVQMIEKFKIIPPETRKQAKKRKRSVDSYPEDYYSPTAKMFFLSKDHSDCTIECEGQEFPSHKVLLSIRSPVFYRMLQPRSGMIEAKDGKIKITDMKPNVLKEFLRFVYYGKVENLKDIAQLLILVADKYDLSKLKDICENSIEEQLNPQNALTFYLLSNLVQAQTLMVRSLAVIKTNISNVFQNAEELLEFGKQHPGAMSELLKI